jgi:hypothetical protein
LTNLDISNDNRTFYVIILLMTISVTIVFVLLLGRVTWGGLYPSFYIQGDKVIRKITESVII